jgi:hypothetical protein
MLIVVLPCIPLIDEIEHMVLVSVVLFPYYNVHLSLKTV